MRIALYIVAALVAIFLAYYLFNLVTAGLMVVWQFLLIAAFVALVVGIAGALLRSRRTAALAVSQKAVPQTVKAQAREEKKAERNAEKELRSLEASLGKDVPSTTQPQAEENTVQQTRRR